MRHRDAEPVHATAKWQVVNLPALQDDRGSLTFGEIGSHLPFTPVRYFLLHNLITGVERGAHAHRKLEQFIICVHGGCTVALDDGRQKDSIELLTPAVAIYVPPMIWTTVRPHSSETVVQVLASDVYDAHDYVRDYDTFTQMVRATR